MCRVLAVTAAGKQLAEVVAVQKSVGRVGDFDLTRPSRHVGASRRPRGDDDAARVDGRAVGKEEVEEVAATVCDDGGDGVDGAPAHDVFETVLAHDISAKVQK
jgi:hypothetical protein